MRERYTGMVKGLTDEYIEMSNRLQKPPINTANLMEFIAFGQKFQATTLLDFEERMYLIMKVTEEILYKLLIYNYSLCFSYKINLNE